jgi:hypothetical protein
MMGDGARAGRAQHNGLVSAKSLFLVQCISVQIGNGEVEKKKEKVATHQRLDTEGIWPGLR